LILKGFFALKKIHPRLSNDNPANRRFCGLIIEIILKDNFEKKGKRKKKKRREREGGHGLPLTPP